MDDYLVITLIRHGRTKENDEKKYIGWTDSCLSKEGYVALQKRELSFKPDLIFSSDLKRCIETASIYFPYARPILSPLLREIHFGDFEQKTFEELKNVPAYQNWLDDPFQGPIPNGERYDQFSQRIQKGWGEVKKRITSHHGIRHVVIVTHGGVIRELLSRFSPVEKPYWSYSVSPGDFVHLTTTETKLRRDERCISLQEALITESENG
ncbi:histidine phosphatase family protein [Bacillus kexueae]|uniref:histidine phosphatase family protein n=1 Tax=Aeribacillus kexueae TaxID=2078952 RepID=UPI001FAF9634|nr:histidine phosphatase family protein [Bacillus kexueae]